jgi:hypothetical protein
VVMLGGAALNWVVSRRAVAGEAVP